MADKKVREDVVKSRKILFLPWWLAEIIFSVTLILVAYMYSETIITAAREIDLGIFGIKPKLEHVSPQDERIKALSHAFE